MLAQSWTKSAQIDVAHLLTSRYCRLGNPLVAVMAQDIPEKDWKLLRQLKPALLDRFCEQVLGQVAKIATTRTGTSHERYLKLYQLIKQKDRDIASAFDDHRRSNARLKLARIRSLGLLTEKEFAEFSEEIQSSLLSINSGS